MSTDLEMLELDEFDLEDEEYGAGRDDGEDFENELALELETEDFEVDLEDGEDFEYGDESDVDVLQEPQQLPDYQVIGADARIRITATRVKPWRHICRLDPPGCTGTLIAPNKVLTAGHCVYNSSGQPYKGMIVTPGRNGPGTSRTSQPFGTRRGMRYQLPTAFVTNYKTGKYNNAWSYDYAVVTLDKPFPKSVGYWSSVRVETDSRLKKLRLNTAGYPGDKGGNHLYWNRDRVISVKDRRIEYLMDTSGGQSGSPVWMKKGLHRYIVAIHTARDDVATPTVANRGLRITSAVLADINRWVKS